VKKIVHWNYTITLTNIIEVWYVDNERFNVINFIKLKLLIALK
jgi:hypothetical protein